MTDHDIAEQLRQELADRKLRKARNRIAKMLAKKNGDLRKMPLSGRAAMSLILRGSKFTSTV